MKLFLFIDDIILCIENHKESTKKLLELIWEYSMVGCSPWGCEESDTTELLPFHFSLSCIGKGNGNPLQHSCLENPRDGRAWWAAVYGVAQSRTRLKRLRSSSSWWLSGKESTCNVGDSDLIPGSGRSPGGGNGNLLEYFCLENSTDRGAWRAAVHGVARVGHNSVTKPYHTGTRVRKEN